MKQIIRIDKSDGSKSIEADDSRVRRTVSDNYPAKVQKKVMKDFLNGERTIANRFAIYEIREVKTNDQTK